MSRDPVLVIAEAGVNHDGNLGQALRLVDVAADAGADIVKFQSFRAEQLAGASAARARYQIDNTGDAESQVDMLRKLELSPDDHRAIAAHCRAREIEFLSTAFDADSLDFLVDEMGIVRVKIPSGELTNGPLLLHAARRRLPMILSTGMSSLAEVAEALGVVAYAWTDSSEAASRVAFAAALATPAGAEAVRDHVVVLQCTTEYPAPFEDVNLLAMDTIRDAFGVAVGLSDHTPGIVASVAAVARGATVIEKHFTLDRNLPGPDHLASLEPDELGTLVTGIRNVEAALGSGEKRVAPSESDNRDIARRSLVAARPISRGTPYDLSNVTAKRPGGGISPMRLWEILGQSAPRDFAPDEALEIEGDPAASGQPIGDSRDRG